MSILVKDVLVDGEKTSLYVEDGRIAEVGGGSSSDRVIDGRGKAAVPGFINTHTHAAMTLLRGYADDLQLHEWLEQHIWPVEGRLTEDDVYWGTRLACLEMIKSGTTCFNDMYWHLDGAVNAVEDSGIRGVLSSVFIDMFSQDTADDQRREALKQLKNTSQRVRIALGPHAIYTVTEESLAWVAEQSEKHDALVHFHLSETEKEVKDCVSMHGKRPVEYLNDLGFLSPRLVCAHCVWLDKKEAELLAEHDVKAAHCPASNMKLSSGVMDYRLLRQAGVTVSLGTDGCASNNNLDMLESMKAAALLQKLRWNDPTVLPAGEAFKMATEGGARALSLDAGLIDEGALADFMLVDLRRPELTPGHSLVSDLVYSANGGCVDTVVCDGRVLMEGGSVEGEDEVLEKAREVALELVSRE